MSDITDFHKLSQVLSEIGCDYIPYVGKCGASLLIYDDYLLDETDYIRIDFDENQKFRGFVGHTEDW